MAEFVDRFRFNLAHALARHFENLPYFFKRIRVSVGKSETKPDNFAFAERQRGKRFVQPFPQRRTIDFDKRIVLFGILEEVAEEALFASFDRTVQRKRRTRRLNRRANFAERQPGRFRDFLRGRSDLRIARQFARRRSRESRSAPRRKR